MILLFQCWLPGYSDWLCKKSSKLRRSKIRHKQKTFRSHSPHQLLMTHSLRFSGICADIWKFDLITVVIEFIMSASGGDWPQYCSNYSYRVCHTEAQERWHNYTEWYYLIILSSPYVVFIFKQLGKHFTYFYFHAIPTCSEQTFCFSMNMHVFSLNDEPLTSIVLTVEIFIKRKLIVFHAWNLTVTIMSLNTGGVLCAKSFFMEMHARALISEKL